MTPSKRFAELLRSLFARSGRKRTSQSSASGPRRSWTPQLECLEDRTLPSVTLFVTSTGNQGKGSLRQAITDANAVSGSDPVQILFNIPTSDKGFADGVYTINLTSAITPITRANVTINGTSQPGYDPTATVTAGSITVAKPKIEVTPNSTKQLAIGFDIQANNVTLLGLGIHGFGQVTGTGDKADIRIGNNVTGTVLADNFIGTSVSAFTRPATGFVSGGHNVLVAGGDGGVIQHNLIGFAGQTGIALQSGSNNWTIGGTGANQGNAIGISGAAGVVVATGATGNVISRNSIFDNGSLGIDVGAPGVTSSGTPSISDALLFGSSMLLIGSGTPGATVELFRARTGSDPDSFADPTGGEGRIYLGTFVVPASGSFMEIVSLAVPVNDGDVLTATATDTSTSEFGANVTAEQFVAGILNGNLRVFGTPGADNVVVDTTNPGAATVQVNGVNYGPFAVPAGGRAIIEVFGGNDTVAVTGILETEIKGDTGDDTFTLTGQTGAVSLDGGAGTDTVVLAGNGNFNLTKTSLSATDGPTATLDGVEVSNLSGGAGNNTFTITNWTGQALIEGGAGSDTVVASGKTDYTLSTTSLSSSDGLSATLNSIENVSLIGTGATAVTVGGWTGTGLDVSGAGAVALSDVSAGSGGIAISAATIQVNGPVLTTAAGPLTLNGDATVAQGGSVTAAGDLSFTRVTATGNLPLTSTAGNITVGVIDAAGLTVTLTAGGAILDGNGALNNITAHTLVMVAGSGIGSAADPIESAAVSFLDAQGGTGGIFVDNTGDLIVTGATASGTIDIQVHSSLSITGQVTSTTGDVTLVAGDGTLTVPQDTVTAPGTVTLTATTLNANLTGASLGAASFTSSAAGSLLLNAATFTGLTSFRGSAFDVDAFGASFASFDVDAAGFDFDASDANFGSAIFKGTNFDIDADGAVFTAVQFDSDAVGFDFEAEGFDIDAAGATFGLFDVDGFGFDVDAAGAVFSAFDVDASGFDLFATGATFGTGSFTGTNFDIDAYGANFMGQVLFDSDAVGFDFEAEGFDIDATDATFGQVFFVGQAFDIDAFDFDLDGTGAVFAHFDVDGAGFDVDADGAVFMSFDIDGSGFDLDATGATFGTGSFTGTNFDIEATGANFTTAVLFDSDALGFDFEAEGFDIDATDATFGQAFFVGNAFDVDAFDFDLDGTGAVFAHFDVDGSGFDVDADGAVFTSFDVDGSGFDLDATDATFGTGSFTGTNFDIEASGANFTGQVLFDSDAVGFDFEAEGFDIDAQDASFGQAFFVGNAFDIDASDGFDSDALGAEFDVLAVLNGSGYVVNLSLATFDQAFFNASNASITAIGSTFDDLWNFAGGTATTINASLATFKSLTNQAQNVTSIKADGATFGRLVNEADNVSNISAVGATFEVIANSGSSVAGIVASGSSRASSLINHGNNVTGINFVGGASSDFFVNTGNNVSASFDGQSGDDTAYVGGTGMTASLAGGPGNDWYTFSGGVAGQVSVIEAYTGVGDASADTLDFSSFTGGAVSIDLASAGLQTVGGLSMTLSDASGVENVIGSAGADMILGNSRDNYLLGADLADDRVTTVSAWNGRTAVVFLDFDTYTNAVVPGVDTGTTDHVYTAEEKAAIQARMEALYHGPDPNPANWWFQVVFTQSASEAAALAGGNGYATIWFNRPRIDPDGSEQPGGESSEVDFRNQSLFGESVIQINGLLGGPGQAADTSVNWVMASANVAAHELAHMMGVRHADAYGPIGYGIHNPPGATAYTPSYPGPAGAFETNYHLITSPASTGSTVAGVVDDLFFGEREAIRLAMAFYAPATPQAGTLVVAEAAGAHPTTASAQQLTLLGLNVPNTLGKGLNVNKQFSVAAVSAVGNMTSAAEVDVYSFQGRAGDLINLEVISDGVIRTGQTTHAINAVIEVLGASGQIIAYYDPNQAVTDDEFESFDAQIIDLRLPSDGTYFVRLTTKAVDSDGNPLTITPETPGVYELFLYRFKAYNPIDGNDVLSGLAGNDVLAGGLGNDTVSGGLGVDVLNGGAGNDTVIGADTTNIWLFSSADAGTINLSSFAGFEQLIGGAVADTFAFANGATITAAIDGGAGTNTLDYSAWTTGVSVNLTTGAATGLVGGVLGHNFQNVIGGSGNDLLIGDDLDNVFTGNAGSDTMDGGLGNDTFRFGATSASETDTVRGGGGMDTLDFSSRSAGITLNLGTVGNAQSVGGGLMVVLQDQDVENVFGSFVGNNVLRGNTLDNILVGGAGNDDLRGESGNDIVVGGDGDDLLTGGAGQDILIGGFGADRLIGSEGDDILLAGRTAFDYWSAMSYVSGGITYQYQGDPTYLALRSILAEWTSSRDYSTRVANISNGAGQSADRLNSDYFFIEGLGTSPNGTVSTTDGAVDILTGAGGRDWFFIQAADSITDLDGNEQTNGT